MIKSQLSIYPSISVYLNPIPIFNPGGEKEGFTHHPLCLKQCSTQAQYENAIALESPIAGSTLIVHGGENNNKSPIKNNAGIA